MLVFIGPCLFMTGSFLLLGWIYLLNNNLYIFYLNHIICCFDSVYLGYKREQNELNQGGFCYENG